MRQKFITKYVRFFITKCDSYYKLRQLYYKMLRILHIVREHLSISLTVSSKQIKLKVKVRLLSSTILFLATFITFPTLVYMQFLNRYYSTFAEGPQCKYKQFDACIVLYCHQQKCCIFVNIDEYYLLTFFCYDFNFNLVFNNFHIFFGKY